MSDKLNFDNGVLELEINHNGLLRFNPTDPNVYQRFLALARELPEMEKRYAAEAEQEQTDELLQAQETLNRMKSIDAELKQRLAGVFGHENDFDVLLGGVNLMAFGSNGERVVTNLLNALLPYMESGAKKHMSAAAAEAVAEAKRNRAQRRAKA